MRKVTVSRMGERYAQMVITFRITYVKINTKFVRIHKCKTPPGRHRHGWNLVLKGMGREDSSDSEQGPITETYRIIFSTEQSPSSEVNSSADSQEISRILWNQNVRYLIHNSPQIIPVLSQPNPVSALASYSFMIHFNIILPSTSSLFVI